LQLTK
jgi:hypothetical protein